MKKGTVGDGPCSGGLVGGGSGDDFAIVGEFDAGDGAFVAGECVCKLIGFVRLWRLGS